MNATDPNLPLLEMVVNSFGSLCERFVFIGGCATGSRLLVTPQNLPDGLVLTKAVCTGSGAASVTFTNYGTAAASGSVSFSYEVIK